MEVTDKFLESKDQSESLLNEATKSLFDAIALITHANCDLNHRRRDLIKPDLNRSYQQICSAPVIRTNYTIIAKYKHFTKDNRASTKCREKQQRGPREDARITHARPTITAGATPSSSSA